MTHTAHPVASLARVAAQDHPALESRARVVEDQVEAPLARLARDHGLVTGLPMMMTVTPPRDQESARLPRQRLAPPNHLKSQKARVPRDHGPPLNHQVTLQVPREQILPLNQAPVQAPVQVPNQAPPPHQVPNRVPNQHPPPTFDPCPPRRLTRLTGPHIIQARSPLPNLPEIPPASQL